MASRSNIPELEQFVNRDNPDEDLRKIFARIRPGWTSEGLKFKPFSSEGLINELLLATHNDDVSNPVVVRIFSDSFTFVIDRKREIAALKVFNERGLSPEIYCIFQNGICMEYLKAKLFKWETISADGLTDQKVLNAAARELARYHSKETTNIALTKYGEIFSSEPHTTRKVETCVAEWPDSFEDEHLNEVLLNQCPSKEYFKTEVNLALKSLRESGAPVSMCHLDANPANLAYFPEQDRALFFDYELSAVSYTAIDLGYFLKLSAVGIDFAKLDSKVHSDDVKAEFFREYLEEQRLLGDLDHDVTEKDVQRLAIQTEKATLVDGLIDAAVTLLMCKRPDQFRNFPVKDVIPFAPLTFAWYEKVKKDVLAKQVPA